MRLVNSFNPISSTTTRHCVQPQGALLSPSGMKIAVGIFTGAEDEQDVRLSGVLLGYFYFDMDIMVSEAIATDTSDPLP